MAVWRALRDHSETIWRRWAPVDVNLRHKCASAGVGSDSPKHLGGQCCSPLEHGMAGASRPRRRYGENGAPFGARLHNKGASASGGTTTTTTTAAAAAAAAKNNNINSNTTTTNNDSTITTNINNKTAATTNCQQQNKNNIKNNKTHNM